MQLTINNYHPHIFVKNLSEQLSVESSTDCLEEIIELPESLGQGRVTGFMFSDGISFIVFDCLLSEDWELKFEIKEPSPLQFIFDIQGELWHALNHGNIRYHLNPLQGSISACPLNSKQNIKIPGKREVLFTMLLVDRATYLNKIDCMVDQMPEKLSSIFTDTNAENSFLYQGNYSIAAAECIRKITLDDHDGIVRSTYLEGKVLELLSRQIKQFKDDLLLPGKQVMLRKNDIDKIKIARDLLIENFHAPPTIAVLAKKSGINQQKLKAGFKNIFDKTINQYLTEERMDMASLLLLKDHSVKEVASEVGYSNHSYFSRKFKAKFGVLPKDYLKSVKAKMSRLEME